MSGSEGSETEKVDISGNYQKFCTDGRDGKSSLSALSVPNTLGGLAAWIDVHGRFAFARQVLSVNVSHAGDYIIKATHRDSGEVVVFRIVVSE